MAHRRIAALADAVCCASLLACTDEAYLDRAGQLAAGAGGAEAMSGGDSGGGATGHTGRAPVRAVVDVATAPAQLAFAPLIAAPTANQFTLNAVLATGRPSRLRVQVRAEGDADFGAPVSPETPADDIAQWEVDGLAPGTRYEYRIFDPNGTSPSSLYEGSVVTQREPGDPFTFTLLTDSHIPIPDVVPADLQTDSFNEQTLLAVAEEMAVHRPDFMIHLGDMLDFHRFGFNVPAPDGSWTRLGYLNYRRLLTDTAGHVAHFCVIGNWEGEDGFFTAEEIERSRQQRLLYLPGPTPDTYPEGGSSGQDYYAFTWGDALFVVLNVMSYTPTAHLLSSAKPGLPDDWTLGGAQLRWLSDTLKAATSRWRFLFIHHTVGGAAGNEYNSGYGRGGGLAAHVGEQATVHALMLQHGVQVMFYGHDHVFVDMVVDGIHYTLPGSAGAPWKFTSAETGYTDYWTESGHARVDLNPDAVEVQFIAVGGDLLHAFTIE